MPPELNVSANRQGRENKFHFLWGTELSRERERGGEVNDTDYLFHYFTIFLSPLQSFHMKQVSRRSIHIDHLVNTI